MSEVEVPQAAVDAVLSHRWGASNLPPDAHAKHNYYGGCAVCRGDVPAVLAVAAPHIAATALRQAADELRADAPLVLTALAAGAYLRRLADALDGRQPEPDTREGILAAAGLTEADMREGTDG